MMQKFFLLLLACALDVSAGNLFSTCNPKSDDSPERKPLIDMTQNMSRQYFCDDTSTETEPVTTVELRQEIEPETTSEFLNVVAVVMDMQPFSDLEQLQWCIQGLKSYQNGIDINIASAFVLKLRKTVRQYIFDYSKKWSLYANFIDLLQEKEEELIKLQQAREACTTFQKMIDNRADIEKTQADIQKIYRALEKHPLLLNFCEYFSLQPPLDDTLLDPNDCGMRYNTLKCINKEWADILYSMIRCSRPFLYPILKKKTTYSSEIGFKVEVEVVVKEKYSKKDLSWMFPDDDDGIPVD
ncbi:MAG TPA: hypothetical protein DHV51_00690 [Opitutae bacterium]|nr:hypothetical protein [Opitutae bacterium]